MTINGEIGTKIGNQDLTTQKFVEKIIPKYLKLERTCSPANYEKCGFPSTVKTPNGISATNPESWSWTELSPAKVVKDGIIETLSWNNDNIKSLSTDWTWNTVHFFRTLDGFSIAFFYNPNCSSSSSDHGM